MKKILLIILIISGILFYLAHKKQDWYFPSWAENAKYNKPIEVLDTESALGRYTKKTKKLYLKDLAKAHGHLCDGLVISFIQIKAAYEKIFPNHIIDRTDIRIVSKNGPCWIDAASIMSGARVNFGTLSIQPEIGNGFIVQKISTGEAYSVHLKEGVFPEQLAILEKRIRTAYKNNKTISSNDIDMAEKLANNLSEKLLNTPPEELIAIKKLKKYKYEFKFQTTERSDVINKNK